MNCRHCNASIDTVFVDLGHAPPSNAYLTADTARSEEVYYPLRVVVCPHCWLVQTEDYAHRDELFSSDYAYFSSFSQSWLRHAEHYVSQMIERFRLSASSLVIELACNDGYLLQYVLAQGIPCLGIEPTLSTAAAARKKGIPVLEEFFGTKLGLTLATQGKLADLIVANNVLAHVPDINDFVRGVAVLLKPQGVATFEFPHFLTLVQQRQFDTIYHEHFSYLSLHAIQRVFPANGLVVVDVEKLPTHGGSLRVFAKRSASTLPTALPASVDAVLKEEAAAGITKLEFYRDFQPAVNRLKNAFLHFLLDADTQGKSVAAYGAAAKGNTLLNYAGIKRDLIRFVVDRNPAKQNKFLPGSHIPIVDEAHLLAERPKYLILLPWNLKDELQSELRYIREWDGKFVTVIPELLIQ